MQIRRNDLPHMTSARRMLAGNTACFIVCSAVLLTPGRCHSATAVMTGEYRMTTKPRTPAQTAIHYRFDLSVELDPNVLVISYRPPLPSPRYEAAPFTARLAINRDELAQVGLPTEPNFSTAKLANAELPWRLGNCSDVVFSCVFMMLRSADLFPEEAAVKTRPLAATFTVAGQPDSLISEATYEYVDGPGGRLLRCETRVSKELRTSWPRSPLLNAQIDPDSADDNVERAKNMVAYYPAGALMERIEFGNFVAINRVRTPTTARIERFVPERDGAKSNSQDDRYQTATVTLRVESETNVPPSLLPDLPPGATVYVSETRMQDRALRLDGFRYQTNRLSTMAISPEVRQRFEEMRTEVRLARFRRRMKIVLALLTIGLFLLGPLCWYFRFKPHSGPMQVTE